MTTGDLLSDRTLSAYPLSIGTSLAFESLYATTNVSYDPAWKPPQAIDMSQYDEVWVNVSTLFRNLMGSLSKENVDRVGGEVIAESIVTEIDFIKSLLKNEGNNRAKLRLYACDYKDLFKKTKTQYASLRTDNTIKQHAYTNLHVKFLSKLIENYKDTEELQLLNCTLKPKEYNTSIVLTHVAYDLLSFKYFKTLDSIDSHTGTLKKRHQWYTRYYLGKELTMIPFTEYFLQIFGDNTTFRPLDARIRKEIISIANADRWTQVTTKDKIKNSLSKIKDHYMRKLIFEIIG